MSQRLIGLWSYLTLITYNKEAYNFLEEQVSAVSSLRHSFQRDLIDGNLNSFIIDLNQNGRNEEIYRACILLAFCR